MLPTTPLTLGAARLGANGSDAEVAALADALLASTLGNVDTSNNYTDGRSEKALGAALARRGGLRDGGLVYSKADADPDGRFDGDRVRRSIDESLSRLGLDRLPVYHLHDPYTISIAEAMAPGGAVPALIALRDEGVIGAVGIAAGQTQLVLDYVLTDAFDAVLTHNRFTLVDRSGLPIIEAARERGMTVFNAAPFGGGMLANGSRETYGYAAPSPEFLAHVDRVRTLAEIHSVDLAAAALHFSLRSPLVDSTVVGISSLARLDALADLASAAVPDAFYADLEALGSPPPSPTD
ncbi:MAG: aldo/keto reductase [Microcella sp.]